MSKKAAAAATSVPRLTIHEACEKGKQDDVKDILVKDREQLNARGELGRTPVMISAITGQKDLFNFLMLNKCDPSLVDDRKYDVLHLACIGGNVEIVKSLLAIKKTNIESKDGFGQTPVMTTAYYGHREVMDLLRGKKCELLGEDNNGNSILHIACLGGNMDMVRYLLNLKLVVIETKGQYGRTPLMMAASMGHQHVFDYLITKGAKLSGLDDNKDSILHIACLGDNVDIAKFILSKNVADINSKGRSGRTPVMKAAEKGHQRLFDLLVEKGCELTTVDDDGNNVIHIASCGGNIRIMAFLMTKDVIDIESRGQYGRTPVMWAAYFGQKGCLNLLVSKGASLKAVDINNDNILHVACAGGHLNMVKYLTTKNVAELCSRGRFGRTALMVAAHKGDRYLFQFLVSKGCDVSVTDDEGDGLIHVACIGGDVDMVKYLLSLNNIDKESRGKHGRTPLMVAADFGQQEIFDLLVSVGCNLTVVDGEGDNILHVASYGGNLNIVRFILLKNVVNIESRGKYGRTAVMKAAEKGNKEVFVFLVSKDCDLTVLDSNGDSILHATCLGGDVEMVKCLIGQEIVDIESRGKFGRTPLMKAVEGGYQQVLELLVEKGCSMLLVDEDKENILHIACANGHLDLVKYILSLGNINKESKGKYGRTPLMTAARKGHRGVFEFLVNEGCNLSVTDTKGDSILHVACSGGSYKMVEYLLAENLYDQEQRGRFGQTPLLTSAYFGHPDIYDLLRSQGSVVNVLDKDKMNALHVATAGGHTRMVKHMLDNTKFDKESQGKYNRTPLMVAAEKGQIKVFDFLVSQGCNVKVVDSQKDNILHVAAMSGNVDMVKHVLSMGDIDLDSRGHDGQTSLMKSASRGHIQVLYLLVSEGSNVSLVNVDGDNIFNIACLGGSVKMVKHLLDKHLGEIEKKGKYGQTPVMKAASMGHKGVFDLLVSEGCDLSVVDQDGDTILHVACFGGNVELVSFLSTLIGVDINKKNNANKTPLQVAKSFEHEGVVAVLEKLSPVDS